MVVSNQFLLPYLSSAGMLESLSDGKSTVRSLLNKLDYKELKILDKNPDLLNRIKQLADILDNSEMSARTFLEKVCDTFGLKITKLQTSHDDVWIERSEELKAKLSEKSRSWLSNTYDCGSYLAGDEEMIAWAKEILIERIRVNIAVRYITHKRSEKLRSAALEGFGLYL